MAGIVAAWATTAVRPLLSDALVEQVRANSRLFFHLAYGILRDTHAAEDACQQAFVQTLTHQDNVRDPKALRARLARVVLNESLQAARAARPVRPAEDLDLSHPEAKMNVYERAELSVSIPAETNRVNGTTLPGRSSL